MAREIPRILQVAQLLLEQWTLVRERRVEDPAQLQNLIIRELATAWDRRYDIGEIIAVWEDLSTRDWRDHPCMCGGWGKLPLWAQLGLDGGAVTAALYASDGGWTTAHCFICNRATTTPPEVSGQSGDECSICGGVGLAPNWVTNAVNFPWGALDRIPEAGMWFPVHCAACGGWGRRRPGELVANAGEVGAIEEVVPTRDGSTLDPGVPVLEREGNVWRVAFNGQEVRIHLRVGLLYLAEMIARPGQPIDVMDLVAMRQPPAEGLPGDPTSMGLRINRGEDGLEASDRGALRQYDERLREISGEIDDAEADNDPGRIARLRREQEHLCAAVASGRGLHGARNDSSMIEAARKSVTKAIRETVALISKHLPALGEHLRNAIVTGQKVGYLPRPPLPAG